MDIDNSIVILIKTISLEIDKLGNQMLLPYDLTYPQFKALKLLFKNPPLTIRQIDIERHFSLSNPTVTGIIQNLEKKGLVERAQNPEDLRSKVLAVTEKARAMEKELADLGARLEERVAGGLSGREREELLALLKKLRESGGGLV